MRKRYYLWIPGALLLAFLAGCAQEQPPTPDTSVPATTTVLAQTEPALPPKPTVEVATQPPATSMPTAEPTAPPTAAPTAAPTEVTTSTALLSADNIWVQSANVVLPLADSGAPLDVAQRGYRTPIYWPKASPNGAYIIYGTERGGLVLVMCEPASAVHWLKTEPARQDPASRLTVVNSLLRQSLAMNGGCRYSSLRTTARVC